MKSLSHNLAPLGLLVVALCCATSGAFADRGIAEYFGIYYRQEITGGAYQGPLDFLRDAAAKHNTAETVLKPSQSRIVTIDRPNGYLRIDDSSNTDQTLTMAVYLKTDGTPILVAGSANCADGCTFAVQFYSAAADRLQPLPASGIVPAIEPRRFIRPGHDMPKALASITPKINYVPARVGTTLTLTPWYGYEAEEQMDKATRAAIRNLVLNWDGKQGRFVEAR